MKPRNSGEGEMEPEQPRANASAHQLLQWMVEDLARLTNLRHAEAVTKAALQTKEVELYALIKTLGKSGQIILNPNEQDILTGMVDEYLKNPAPETRNLIKDTINNFNYQKK